MEVAYWVMQEHTPEKPFSLINALSLYFLIIAE
jgi:hypothetical protein